MKHKHTNSLARETSPYLLQHAYNPVEWLPWGETARTKALSENKLMLVSIGYSSCHWCHVMERECFEDEAVAQIMNAAFVNVKVDREERPDVDQVYMEAVQMMNRQGGWPLNCFTTPDGLPVYGGTYFPKDKWINILNQLSKLWAEDPEQFRAYGEKMKAGMAISGGIPGIEDQKRFDTAPLKLCIQNWKKRFDNTFGGPEKAPKFPLPCNYAFLLHYGHIIKDESVVKHVELTLDTMALGGIYDQVGGGFARYSTDVEWKVPHFEKMLYDNAQLIGLYAEAFHAFGKREYLEVVKSIYTWLIRDMKHPAGGYFSAIDADSEGVEGLYYTWDEHFAHNNSGQSVSYRKFYHVGAEALWEERLIPVRIASFAEMAKAIGTDIESVISELNQLNGGLLTERQKRISPLIDTKCICSWNCMLASGLSSAYKHTGISTLLDESISIMKFVETHLSDHESGELKHTWKDGKAKIQGFLDDYAFAADAYLKLYDSTFDEYYLQKAKALAFIAIDKYYDTEKGLFFFISSDQTDLITRPVELSDNVIPSTNSVMAHVLDSLASYFDLPHFRDMASRLLNAVTESMVAYGSGYAHWADLHLKRAVGSIEVVATGPKAIELMNEINKEYNPLTLRAAALSSSKLPVMDKRFDEDKSAIYVCHNFSCRQPVETAMQAMNEIKKAITIN
jgi:uncharacterized protein YyaL (SSP411 family)